MASTKPHVSFTISFIHDVYDVDYSISTWDRGSVFAVSRFKVPGFTSWICWPPRGTHCSRWRWGVLFSPDFWWWSLLFLFRCITESRETPTLPDNRPRQFRAKTTGDPLFYKSAASRTTISRVGTTVRLLILPIAFLINCWKAAYSALLNSPLGHPELHARRRTTTGSFHKIHHIATELPFGLHIITHHDELCAS